MITDRIRTTNIRYDIDRIEIIDFPPGWRAFIFDAVNDTEIELDIAYLDFAIWLSNTLFESFGRNGFEMAKKYTKAEPGWTAEYLREYIFSHLK